MSKLTGKEKIKTVWQFFILFAANAIPNALIVYLMLSDWSAIPQFLLGVGKGFLNALEFMGGNILIFVPFFFIIGSPIIVPLIIAIVTHGGRQFLIILIMAITSILIVLSLLGIIVFGEEIIATLFFLNIVVPAIEGAQTLKLGEYKEDSTYVSGSHYEITFDSDEKGTVKEVNDYSGGGEWFGNMLLFILRFLIVLCGGVIIFVVKAIILGKRVKEYTEYQESVAY